MKKITNIESLLAGIDAKTRKLTGDIEKTLSKDVDSPQTRRIASSVKAVREALESLQGTVQREKNKPVL